MDFRKFVYARGRLTAAGPLCAPRSVADAPSPPRPKPRAARPLEDFATLRSFFRRKLATLARRSGRSAIPKPVDPGKDAIPGFIMKMGEASAVSPRPRPPEKFPERHRCPAEAQKRRFKAIQAPKAGGKYPQRGNRSLSASGSIFRRHFPSGHSWQDGPCMNGHAEKNAAVAFDFRNVCR